MVYSVRTVILTREPRHHRGRHRDHTLLSLQPTRFGQIPCEDIVSTLDERVFLLFIFVP